VRENFIIRSKVVQFVRKFLDDRKFLEVRGREEPFGSFLALMKSCRLSLVSSRFLRLHRPSSAKSFRGLCLGARRFSWLSECLDLSNTLHCEVLI
jgi:hypothetical protein